MKELHAKPEEVHDHYAVLALHHLAGYLAPGGRACGRTFRKGIPSAMTKRRCRQLSTWWHLCRLMWFTDTRIRARRPRRPAADRRFRSRDGQTLRQPGARLVVEAPEGQRLQGVDPAH